MAYFNQEMKKEKAPKIKTILKKYGIKGSLSVDNHSTVVLTLRSGKIDFLEDKEHKQVNVYHVDCHFEGIQKDFLEECLEVLNDGNWNKSDIMTDYFNVGWYVEIKIGRWNKPYIFES